MDCAVTAQIVGRPLLGGRFTAVAVDGTALLAVRSDGQEYVTWRYAQAAGGLDLSSGNYFLLGAMATTLAELFTMAVRDLHNRGEYGQ